MRGSNLRLTGCGMRAKNRGGMRNDRNFNGGMREKILRRERDLLVLTGGMRDSCGLRDVKQKITRYGRYGENCNSNQAGSGLTFWVGRSDRIERKQCGMRDWKSLCWTLYILYLEMPRRGSDESHFELAGAREIKIGAKSQRKPIKFRLPSSEMFVRYLLHGLFHFSEWPIRFTW